MKSLIFVSFLASAILVGFGQPAWSSFAGILASSCGFAGFWKTMLYLPNRKYQFWVAVLWFGAAQAIQLSWMTSTHYLGLCILFVYLFLILGLGVQFALLSLFLTSGKPILFRKCLAIAGCWVLFEWSRIFFLSGFTWNPVGLSLSCSQYAIQFASLFGVYGLSFWVILVNLLALNAFFLKRTYKNGVLWALFALFPYGFGFFNQMFVEDRYQKSAPIFSVALVETALSVEQKERVESHLEDLISPLDQWVRVWRYLKPERAVDLIVLPEGAFPGTAYRPYYFLEKVKKEWVGCFGKEALASLPALESPLAFPYLYNQKIHWEVNNAFLAQALANYFHSDVIVGLNDDTDLMAKYNAAFCFHPDKRVSEKYLKRILAPVGEYIPLGHISWIAKQIEENFGICDSFDRGKEATLFSGVIPIGAAICLEEIYTEAVRELRQKGAQLLVSLSNDVWFPSSRLAEQHFDHGRMRAVENGVYLLRSSNMGVTGGVDCLGRSFERILGAEKGGGALYLSLPLYSYPTLYSWWGDLAILLLSALFSPFLFFIKGSKRENLARK